MLLSVECFVAVFNSLASIGIRVALQILQPSKDKGNRCHLRSRSFWKLLDEMQKLADSRDALSALKCRAQSLRDAVEAVRSVHWHWLTTSDPEFDREVSPRTADLCVTPSKDAVERGFAAVRRLMSLLAPLRNKSLHFIAENCTRVYTFWKRLLTTMEREGGEEILQHGPGRKFGSPDLTLHLWTAEGSFRECATGARRSISDFLRAGLRQVAGCLVSLTLSNFIPVADDMSRIPVAPIDSIAAWSDLRSVISKLSCRGGKEGGTVLSGRLLTEGGAILGGGQGTRDHLTLPVDLGSLEGCLAVCFLLSKGVSLAFQGLGTLDASGAANCLVHTQAESLVELHRSAPGCGLLEGDGVGGRQRGAEVFRALHFASGVLQWLFGCFAGPPPLCEAAEKERQRCEKAISAVRQLQGDLARHLQMTFDRELSKTSPRTTHPVVHFREWPTPQALDSSLRVSVSGGTVILGQGWTEGGGDLERRVKGEASLALLRDSSLRCFNGRGHSEYSFQSQLHSASVHPLHRVESLRETEKGQAVRFQSNAQTPPASREAHEQDPCRLPLDSSPHPPPSNLIARQMEDQGEDDGTERQRGEFESHQKETPTQRNDDTRRRFSTSPPLPFHPCPSPSPSVSNMTVEDSSQTCPAVAPSRQAPPLRVTQPDQGVTVRSSHLAAQNDSPASPKAPTRLVFNASSPLTGLPESRTVHKSDEFPASHQHQSVQTDEGLLLESTFPPLPPETLCVDASTSMADARPRPLATSPQNQSVAGLSAEKLPESRTCHAISPPRFSSPLVATSMRESRTALVTGPRESWNVSSMGETEIEISSDVAEALQSLREAVRRRGTVSLEGDSRGQSLDPLNEELAFRRSDPVVKIHHSQEDSLPVPYRPTEASRQGSVPRRCSLSLQPLASLRSSHRDFRGLHSLPVSREGGNRLDRSLTAASAQRVDSVPVGGQFRCSAPPVCSFRHSAGEMPPWLSAGACPDSVPSFACCVSQAPVRVPCGPRDSKFCTSSLNLPASGSEEVGRARAGWAADLKPTRQHQQLRQQKTALTTRVRTSDEPEPPPTKPERGSFYKSLLARRAQLAAGL
uniref:Uncharacterized protein n=1 Tax=Chromera velia CCMP2878 TaxID=1169474 RepID=A0A0G4GNZ0_9ALVE|eukprot:Cvel_22743.t1-p1 / transcript=Cvel_22743.t1 / gene=Cvel_22743 / organism=Chromera_velia_CCMP2878 / gene_product=hypothetical protein / transcript_product=hypothetical protein / location=Cvel_scaffold2269:8914-13865(-) / protein_length=1081 / sequence_SO=supercontig / SO=protein_coding / is_pseudo=false